MSTRPHGYARYKLDGCRCYTCGWATSQYNYRREQAVTAGTWQPYVDAEPVRAHILALSSAGIGRRRIAVLTGVAESSISKLRRGVTTRVRPETAERIQSVAVGLRTLGDSACVPAAGTQRRLQALVAVGWPLSHLAAELGMQPNNFGRVVHDASFVTAATARATSAMYDRLWDREPPTTRQAVARARNYARTHGWAPPMAWDDDEIDDPNAKPRTGDQRRVSQRAADEEVVTRICAGEDREAATTGERREAVRVLTAQGVSVSEIADRLGISERSVQRHRAALTRAEAA